MNSKGINIIMKKGAILFILMIEMLLCSCKGSEKNIEMSDNKQKKITIGCYFLSEEISNQINAFKSENEDYEIIVKEYMDYTDDELANVRDVYSQFNLDIISGNVPDIMIFNSDMPVERYISKGVLCDLTSYFQNDAGLELSDYMSNIFSCYNPDSGLYVLPSEFYLTGYICSRELIPNVDVSIDEIGIVQKKNQIHNNYIFGLNTREQILVNYLMHNGRRLIDINNHTCTFNSDEFLEVMDFVKRCPKEFDSNDAIIDNYYNVWNKHQALFLNYSVGSFYDFAVAEQVYFREKINIVGFPGSKQKLPSIATDFLFAISDKSEHKDVAWDFVSRFFKYEHQNSRTDAFPVAKESLYKLCLNSQGTDFEGTSFYYGSDKEQIMDSLSEESALELFQLIECLDNSTFLDENVIQIIIEEANCYFEDEKDLETVINNMENRVNIYINE